MYISGLIPTICTLSLLYRGPTLEESSRMRAPVTKEVQKYVAKNLLPFAALVSIAPFNSIKIYKTCLYLVEYFLSCDVKYSFL